MLKKILAIILTVIMLASSLTAVAQVDFEGDLPFYLGTFSGDMISAGGQSVNGDGGRYYIQDKSGYICFTDGDNTSLILDEECKLLNFYNGMLYFVQEDYNGSSLCRFDIKALNKTVVYTFDGNIDLLYSVNDTDLYFSSENCIYNYNITNGICKVLLTADGLRSFIPTKFGIIYATGTLFDYCVYAGDVLIGCDIEDYYIAEDIDDGVIVYSREGHDYQVPIDSAFDGDIKPCEFEGYGIVDADELLGGEYIAQENTDIDEEIQRAEYEAMGVPYEYSQISMFATVATNTKALSTGQTNIVKRSHQMTDVKWKPLANIPKWGGSTYFYKGTTYTGLPYGQAVYSSYVPWSTSIPNFVKYVNDSGSKMYTSTSTYNKTAPYYSTDCSAFVAWAWNLAARQTTSTIANFATKISSSSYANAQVGDCLNDAGSHVVLITDITYDSNGAINGIEISESTPPITKITWYGTGHSYSLSTFSSKYFSNGYILYRSKTRDNASYTHYCVVPLEGDTCSVCGVGHTHKYTSTVTNKPTCTVDGVKTYKCDCGDSYTENISALGHNYSQETTDPTCTEDGYTVFTCSDCNDSYTEHPTADWTDWTLTAPDNIKAGVVDTKTQYRTSNYGTFTSYTPNLSDCTLISEEWEESDSGTIYYTEGWNSGFDTSHSIYKTYNNKPKTAGETDTAKTVTNSKISGYIYWHWCRGNDSLDAGYNRAVAQTKNGNSAGDCGTFDAFYSTTAPSSETNTSYGGTAHKYVNTDCCGDTYWWYAIPVYKQTYTEYKHKFTYTGWTEWSDWTDEKATENDTLKVETQTLYRTRLTAMGHNYEITEHTPHSCNTHLSYTYKCEYCDDGYTEFPFATWSDWLNDIPDNINENYTETKTEYRYRVSLDTVKTANTDLSGLSGYTLTSSNWEQKSSGTISYVKTWPSGFDTTHSVYTKYNQTPRVAFETQTAKTEITEIVQGYIYWHWCRGNDSLDLGYSRAIALTKNGNTGGDCGTFDAFYSTASLSDEINTKYGETAYKYMNADCCGDSYWWYAIPVYKQTYKNFDMMNTFNKWGEWSDWSDTEYTPDEGEVQTESRTLYRYITSEFSPYHKWSEGVVTAEPTATKNGTMLRTCEDCDKTLEISIMREGLIYGDGDSDSNVTADDLTLLKKYIMGDTEISDTTHNLFDLNADGMVDMLDLLRLKLFLAGNDVKMGPR